jgi:hypothetical protein
VGLEKTEVDLAPITTTGRSRARGNLLRWARGTALTKINTMTHTHWTRPLLIGNGILLLAVAGLLAGRVLPTAGGQTTTIAIPVTMPSAEPQPSQLTVVPAQISSNQFGCYLLDATHQTLSVYQYQPGDNDLKFLAARDVSFDHLVKSYNTSPPPSEIKTIVERAMTPGRVTGGR